MTNVPPPSTPEFPPPVPPSVPQGRGRWYEQTWFLIVSLLFCFPVGLFFVWRRPCHRNVKIGITAAVAVLFVIAAVASGGSKKPSSTASATPTTLTATTAPTRATTSTRAQPTTTTRPPATTTTRVAAPPKKNVNDGLNTQAKQVASTVTDVLTLVTEGEQTPPQATADQVAQGAQEAHDILNNLKANEPDAFSHSGDAGYRMYDALNGLKNSMGALVTYLGNPNPATLASFKTQYAQAKDEWNAAVQVVYAKSSQPKPTIDL